MAVTKKVREGGAAGQGLAFDATGNYDYYEMKMEGDYQITSTGVHTSPSAVVALKGLPSFGLVSSHEDKKVTESACALSYY